MKHYTISATPVSMIVSLRGDITFFKSSESFIKWYNEELDRSPESMDVVSCSSVIDHYLDEYPNGSDWITDICEQLSAY